MHLEKEKHDLIPCPVCGNSAFEEEDDYDICEVCGWENEILQTKNPDYAGGANTCSLNEAKKLWSEGKTVFEGFPHP